MLALFGQQERGRHVDAHDLGVLSDEVAQTANIGATNDDTACVCG